LGMADDQQIADYIKSRLQVEQSQGNLKGFNVDMRVERGTVWFKGHVSNPAQEMTILKAAQQAGHLGVVQVVDDIEVKGKQVAPQTQPIPDQTASSQQQPIPDQTARYQQQPIPDQTARYQQQPIPDQTAMYQQRPMSNQPVPFAQVSSQQPAPMAGAAQGVVTGGQPLPFASSNGSGMAQSAMPVSYASSAGMPSEAPNLPGYAWPGYAAHPNYGAVSYPQQYSASAWPYIGPFYPYPQVPLGWRKVSLEWDDGWWMLDFHDK
jgi:hypothetical protein